MRKHSSHKIYVLIACEESQTMCKAFRDRGCLAYSCDIQPCRKGGWPKWHIQGDATPLIQGRTTFHTTDGRFHRVPRWTLIIAHPPCTYLCKVSSVQMVHHGIVDKARLEKMYAARDFFFMCLNAKAKFVAVENPLPMRRAQLPPATCYVCPSQFGHKYTKKTLLWLKNLPPILPTIFYPNPKQFVRSSRGKYRARTFEGVANACADQWLTYIKSHI